MRTARHQYIERKTSRIVTERLYSDFLLNALFSLSYEHAPALYGLLTSPRMSDFLSYLNFGLSGPLQKGGVRRFIQKLGIDLSECVGPPGAYDTALKIFERKIRYWETRPMPGDPYAVVAPADARMLILSLHEQSHLFVKNKFFCFRELFGNDKKSWLSLFEKGSAAVFRLTPDNYHYNHTPVSGTVVDIFEVPGCYNPVNPGTTITLATPYSKNRRVVTIIDTDVSGGTHAGYVAMIEIVALMIGDVVQCYSDHAYADPQQLQAGMFIRRGQPKSLYRPGSSTDLLLFEKDRVAFCEDLIQNMYHQTACSRFSLGFGMPLVETGVQVRSCIARAIKRGRSSSND